MDCMKRSLLILVALGAGAFLPVSAQVLQPPAPASQTSYDDASYNPDPGASKKPIQAPFYQTPPGTPPDYGTEREPLLDEPHAPPLDIRRISKVWQNRDYPEEQLPP